MQPPDGSGSWLCEVPLANIPARGLLPVRLPNGDQIVVARLGDRLGALDDECSHQAMPLSAGSVCDDGSIECPLHGARFDLTTGRCLRGPATDDIAAYEVRIERDRAQIFRRR